MTIIQTKTCAHCGASFDITQSDLDFYAKISPKFGDYVAEIPAPTLCPDCRLRRRLAFRNERNLYVRECDASKKPIISMYSPDKSIKVYDQKIRWSDSRNAMGYGRDFDFSRTFTEQFGELMSDVPYCALATDFTQQENCDYTNSSGPGKNCYMVFETAYCENVFYSRNIFHSQDCSDCLQVKNMNNCYACVDSEDCV